MREEDLKLDGNAIAGLLREIFTVEMTLAECTCGGCGRVHALGRVDVYANAPGVVARCPDCTQVVLRLVRGPQTAWLDMRGTVALAVPLPAGG